MAMSSQNSLTLVFEHPDFIVIDKPAGLSFHGQNSEDDVYQMGIVDLAKQQFGFTELWPVHRLDQMTSGLLILAKSANAAAEFGKQFAHHHIQKFYLALGDKKPKKKQGWVKGDMESARRGSYKLLKTLNNPAITQFISESIQPNLRAYLLKPHTGKTHQLRVMMKSIGAPIIGDTRYHDATLAGQQDRGYLHAYALQFNWKNQSIEIIQPPQEGALFELAHTFVTTHWAEPWLKFKSKN